MALPNRVYDDEGDVKNLSAQERANRRWGMAPKDENLETAENESAASTKTGLEKARESWGEASVVSGEGGSSTKGNKREKEDAEDAGTMFRDALKEDKREDTGLYNNKQGTGSGNAKKGGFLGKFKKNKKLLAGAGAGITGLVLAGFALFNFLGIFKLQHILDNIDAKSFARFNAVFDNRSDKWVKAYVQIRMFEFNGTANPGQDNHFFRAQKVDTDRPLTDWYRTLRTSRFEQDVFNKHGIYFTSMVDAVGNPRTGLISVRTRSQDINFTFDPVQEYGGEANARNLFNQINAGGQSSIDALNTVGTRLDEFINLDIFENSQEARRAIKKVVNDNTHFLRVLRRRHIRKDIQNMTGVTEWKFFETRRNNRTQRKIEIQRKLLRKLIPADTRSGKFLLCIFGAGSCPKNGDVNNPENKTQRSFSGRTTDTDGDRAELNPDGSPVTDEDGNIVRGDGSSTDAVDDLVSEAVDNVANATDEAASAALRAELLRGIMTKLNIAATVINIVDTMDMLSRIDSNIMNGRLSQLATVAKGTQAAAAYTTYSIMRDQTKTGQLTADEYNVIMEGLNGLEKSEAYDYFFNDELNHGNTSQERADFCNDSHVPAQGEYYWNCDSTKIGGRTNASRIESLYMNSVGRILHPIVEDYNSARDNPVTGFFFDVASWISGRIGDLVSAIIDPIFDALGITGGIERALAWLTEKVVAFLGAGPILTGFNDLAGLILTMIGQGAAYVAESVMRASGAGRSNPGSQLKASEIAYNYAQEQNQTMSFTERYFSTANPESFASQTLFSLSTLKATDFGSLKTWVGNLFSSGISIVSPRIGAQPSFAGAASFAGIDTYDFPAYCLDRDPFVGVPAADMTNADDLTNDDGEPFIDASDLTMELLGDVDAFWNKVYERVDDNSEDPQTVLDIYNCETLDRRVRGGLGFTSGYTSDGGLESGIVNPQTVNGGQ